MTNNIKKEKLHTKVLNTISAAFVLKYEEFANNVIGQYKSNQSLSALSNKYTINDLPQDLKNKAEKLRTYNQIAPFLVDRMLAHDEVALKLYIHLFHDYNPKITITSWEIYSDNNILHQYQSLGADADALAEINGELWLNSPSGALYFDS